MKDGGSSSFEDYLRAALIEPAPEAAMHVARALAEKHSGAAIFLYGSGISLSAAEDPTAILYDFYVIAPNYADAIGNRLERISARLIPPNVYYFETMSPIGLLRSKYAVLSAAHFERLVSERTFHSYFWARFAQPSRLVVRPVELERRMIAGVRTAIETFLQRVRPLAEDPRDWRDIWLTGLNASYRAELRAEKSDRAEKLVDHYGDWPRITAGSALDDKAVSVRGAALAWRLRAVLGAFLSIARLLKATATFKGGLDYIAWKVERHAGVDVGVKPWERRHPFIAAPIVALRYYRLRAAARRAIGNEKA